MNFRSDITNSIGEACKNLSEPHGGGMLTPKRKSQVIDGEVTEPIKITGRERREVCSAWDKKHFRMTLLLRKREESVPVDALRGIYSAKKKKEKPDRHEETKGVRWILARAAVVDLRAPKALSGAAVEDL